MRKLFAILIFLASAMTSLADVRLTVPANGQLVIIPGTTQETYIFRAPSPGSGIWIQMINGNSGAQQMISSIRFTSNNAATSYSGFLESWELVYPVPTSRGTNNSNCLGNVAGFESQSCFYSWIQATQISMIVPGLTAGSPNPNKIIFTFFRHPIVMPDFPGTFRYNNITTATTTVIKSGAGVLHTIVVNNTGCSITVYDNTAGSGVPILTTGTLAGGVPVTLTYDVRFFTGLTVVTGVAACNITVSYQ